MPELGRLEKVPLRELWAHEALDFTPWLAQEANIALLSEAIGLELALEAQEQSVGPFRADLLCKDALSDNWVLVENQIARTDHTHLGQLLTYAAGLDAVTIIWIAERFTDEHRAALNWLNQITGEKFNFFGLEIELWKIGNSLVAPKFNLVSKPNNWSKAVTDAARTIHDASLTPIKQLQLEYWTSFRDYMLTLNNGIQPQQKTAAQSWMSIRFGASPSHIDITVNSTAKSLGLVLLIGGGNRVAVFRSLLQEKDIIENAIGHSLVWRETPDHHHSKIGLERLSSDVTNKADWPVFHSWHAEMLLKFKNCFAPRLYSLKLISSALSSGSNTDPVLDSDNEELAD